MDTGGLIEDVSCLDEVLVNCRLYCLRFGVWPICRIALCDDSRARHLHVGRTYIAIRLSRGNVVGGGRRWIMAHCSPVAEG